MNIDNNSSQLQDFARLARDYCAWAEGAGGSEDVMLAERLLTRIHSSVVAVSLVFPNDDRFDTVPEFSVANWKLIKDRFGNLPIREYRKIFNPFNEEELPVFCDLADDLADIYSDLKRGLVLFDGQHIDNALWEWKFNYLIHWGKHLLGALTAIHEFLSERALEDAK